MKYVMFEATMGKHIRKIPVIFPNNLVHAEVAQAFTKALQAHDFWPVKPISAGEVSIFGNEIHCSGNSETLGLTAVQTDARTIQMYDYLHGLE